MIIFQMIIRVVALCCLHAQFGECRFFNIASLFQGIPKTNDVVLTQTPQSLSDEVLETPSKDDNYIFPITVEDTPVKQYEFILNSPDNNKQVTEEVNTEGPKDKDNTIQVSKPSVEFDMKSIIDTLKNALFPLSKLIKKGKITVRISTEGLETKPNDKPPHINPTDTSSDATITFMGSPLETPGKPRLIINEETPSTEDNVDLPKEPQNPPVNKDFNFDNVPQLFSDILNVNDANKVEPVTTPLISSEQKLSPPKLDKPLPNIIIQGLPFTEPTQPSATQEALPEQSKIRDLLNNSAFRKLFSQQIASFFKSLLSGKNYSMK